jgi:peptidoglycan hydrolase-like protein with peptidoglycan-binding domain
MNKKTKISSVSLLLLAVFSLLTVASAAPVHASSQAAANAARAYNLYISSLRSRGVVISTKTTAVRPIAVKPTAVRTEAAVKTSTAVLAATPSKYYFSRDLELGDVSADVKALQTYFNNNGYEIVSAGYGSKGHETDYFGQATKEALISFQKAHNISPAAGYFGHLTRSVINK